MTDSKEPEDRANNETDMDPRFENLAGYVLDALDDEAERAEVEALIDSDRAALAEFNELAAAADLLAIAVPPVAPPARLKATILEQAAREPVPEIGQPTPITAAPKSSRLSRVVRSGYSASTAAAIVIAVIAGALGIQNNRLGGEIDSLRTDLSTEVTAVAGLRSDLSTTVNDADTRATSMQDDFTEMEDEFIATTAQLVHQEEMVSELAETNTALQQALRDQSWLTYVAMKEGYQVESWLADNQTTSDASGLIAVQIVGNEAVFQVHGLAQPQPGYAYTLWMLGHGLPTPVAQFEISEIGSATFEFLLPAPFYFYSSVAVTQERVDGIGSDPLGVTVLSAETN
jgi:hypothetical protein